MRTPTFKFALLFSLTGLALTLAVAHSLKAAGKTASARDFLKNAQRGNPQLKNVGVLHFGPHGLLLVAEPGSASVVAIDTGDTGPVKKLERRIDDVAGLLASKLGTTADKIRINDLAVNPASGKIYLSVLRQSDNRALLLTIDSAGQVAELPLENASWVRVPLPPNDATKIRTLTDVAFAKDRVVVAGASSEEFSSKIFTLPLPLEHGKPGKIFSAETYHVAHKKWETKAPISSFVPYEEGGKSFIVGAFACTPIAKFPLDSLESGANVKGISVVELGSGNRPLDMFTYSKGGKQWLVTQTARFKADLIGPSKYWGARVDMNHIAANDASKVNENAVHRTRGQVEGIEIVESLAGAVHLDKFTNEEAVVLRESGEKLVLELARLP